MCGAPERLPACVRCAHLPSVITTIMDQKLQLLKPLTNLSCVPCSITFAKHWDFLILIKMPPLFTSPRIDKVHGNKIKKFQNRVTHVRCMIFQCRGFTCRYSCRRQRRDPQSPHGSIIYWIRYWEVSPSDRWVGQWRSFQGDFDDLY
jgi:hypothetical protein